MNLIRHQMLDFVFLRIDPLMSTQFPGVLILKIIKKLFLCGHCQDSTLGDFSRNAVIIHNNKYNSFWSDRDQVKNWPSEICGREPFKADSLLSSLLSRPYYFNIFKGCFHKFYLVHTLFQINFYDMNIFFAHSVPWR